VLLSNPQDVNVNVSEIPRLGWTLGSSVTNFEARLDFGSYSVTDIGLCEHYSLSPSGTSPCELWSIYLLQEQLSFNYLFLLSGCYF